MEHARMSLLSSADYLAMEQASNVRHEFVAGQIFAMVGARDRHNAVALNIASALRVQVPERCGVYIGDVKLRVEAADAYYYPDVFVTCDARETDPYIKQYPTLVVEVLSPSTEGVDRREKLRNYRLLDTLFEYAIVSVEDKTVELYRRVTGGEWHVFRFSAGDEHIDFVSVGASISMVDAFKYV